MNRRVSQHASGAISLAAYCARQIANEVVAGPDRRDRAIRRRQGLDFARTVELWLEEREIAGNRVLQYEPPKTNVTTSTELEFGLGQNFRYCYKWLSGACRTRGCSPRDLLREWLLMAARIFSFGGPSVQSKKHPKGYAC
jgi:hypothetical protein